MFHFLHTFHPIPVLATIGPFVIRWYGLLLACGALAGFFVSQRLARRSGVSADNMLTLAAWVIIAGFIGARLYHVVNEFGWYWTHPADIVKVWNGGLAIHGAVLAGAAVVVFFARRWKVSAWTLTDVLVPGLILGQAIGRWGNFFNQELFGRPTALPWGIPIDPLNRPPGYADASFFHPTFLYESIWDIAIFAVLLWLARRWISDPSAKGRTTLLYVLLYSMGRFGVELLRTDATPVIAGIRLPILVSAAAILGSCAGLWYLQRRFHHPLAQP